MTINALHIICLKQPYPVQIGADYELFYKIKALHELGVQIKLHCFLKKDELPNKAIEQYCSETHFYTRTKKISFSIPYIVNSRKNEALNQRLLQDDLPILIEGIHGTGICFNPLFEKRNIVIRAHNVEQLYYRGLYQSAPWGFKKLYYYLEANLLEKFERKIASKYQIACLSENDALHFRTTYKAKNAVAVPVFFEAKYNPPLGQGSFCLYHGNLSVAENEEAVIWLIKNVFAKNNQSFVIAGRNPSKKLVDLSHQHINCCIAINPSDAELNDLISKAHINILPSINATGVKLKLLQALHLGRFCLTNLEGANGFTEKELFLQSNDANGFIELIDKYINIPFSDTLKENRLQILEKNYATKTNALKLLSLFDTD